MRKPVSIQKLSIYRYEIPLKIKVFIRGISFSCKRGLLAKFEDTEGNESWGEISLLPPTEEKIKTCIEWVEKNYHYLLGEIDFSSLDTYPEIKFAIISALDYFNYDTSDFTDIPVKVNALLAGEFYTILEEAERKRSQGYSVFKIKMGEYSLTTAVDLISRIQTILGNEIQIVLDLNRQWALHKTLDLIEQIADTRILYIED
ncbi:MAG: enolase C-terminal domain-like protein, partial [Candidatus Hydrogenedens sp.]